MDISLVIPAYNEEKWIGATLDSVLKNAPGEFKEIIVVDNASTDRTAEVARAYPSVRVIREERKGTGFAREAGFRAASGALIAFLDADTRMRAEWVGKVKRAFARDPNLVCMTGPYWFYDLPRATAVLLWLNWHFALIRNYFPISFGIVGGNFAIRRDILERMNGFDTSIAFYGDDLDTGIRASRYGRVWLSFAITLDSSGRRHRKFGVFRTAWTYIRIDLVGWLTGSSRYHPDSYEEVR